MKYKNYLFLLIAFVIITNSSLYAQVKQYHDIDSIAGHSICFDLNHNLLGWYKPEIPGASYAEVVKRASEFMLNVPIDSASGEKMYFVTSCFRWTPEHKKGEVIPSNLSSKNWPANPADTYAGMVQSLAVGYYAFSGQTAFIGLVRSMLEHQLECGTTPENWLWSQVPYASSRPFEKKYDGGENDGQDVIEPDKVGKLGYAYLQFYEITEDVMFLEASLHCADALSFNVSKAMKDSSYYTTLSIGTSPWPFRVNAKTGIVVSDYCSNVVDPIKLFNELLRIKEQINLNDDRCKNYKVARDVASLWLYSIKGPMKTFVWDAFFEDIGNDPERANRNQLTPMEWAKYIIRHPEQDSCLEDNVPALLHWVKSVFGDAGTDAIKEQTWCFGPMGSHSARYAAACALWFEKTRDPYYKEEAYRHFNYATYMTYGNGVVEVGQNWKESWWTDGYGDYIQHFLDGMAAVPEWAPAKENHLLRSSSIVRSIEYKKNGIIFTTYDHAGSVKLKLITRPSAIWVEGKLLKQKMSENGFYSIEKIKDGGVVLEINYVAGNTIHIQL